MRRKLLLQSLASANGRKVGWFGWPDTFFSLLKKICLKYGKFTSLGNMKGAENSTWHIDISRHHLCRLKWAKCWKISRHFQDRFSMSWHSRFVKTKKDFSNSRANLLWAAQHKNIWRFDFALLCLPPLISASNPNHKGPRSYHKLSNPCSFLSMCLSNLLELLNQTRNRYCKSCIIRFVNWQPTCAVCWRKGRLIEQRNHKFKGFETGTCWT